MSNMSNKNIEMMKKIIAQKKEKQKEQEKQKPNRKIGSGRVGITNMKTGGSNNKV